MKENKLTRIRVLHPEEPSDKNLEATYSSDSTIKRAKCSIIESSERPLEHRVRLQSTDDPTDPTDDVAHRGHRRDRLRAAQRGIDCV